MRLVLAVLLRLPTALAATAGSRPATGALRIGTALLDPALLAPMSMRVGSTPAVRDSPHRPGPTPSWTRTAMLALAPLGSAWHRLRRS